MDSAKFWSPYSGAVSLTFDDGTLNQLEVALPLLDKYALKASFYICPQGNDWKKRLAPWKKVALNGHEIGNHTLSHYGPGSVSGSRKCLENLTLHEMEMDICKAQERLVTLAPHQKEWTFCYPCYGTQVGRGLSRQSYVPIVAKHFISGRAGGEYGFGNHPEFVDLACTAGLATERMSGHEMVGLVEENIANGKWIILVFHEINGRRLTVGAHDFEMLLSFLKRNSKRIWTAPVVAVAKKIR